MLGVDVGERRIGVAVSEGRLAVPLVIIEHESRGADIDRVVRIALEQEASAVVVGLPIGMSGEEGEQAKRTRRFGDALARRLAAPVIYQDERLSSAQVTGAAGGRIDRAGTAGARRASPRSTTRGGGDPASAIRYTGTNATMVHRVTGGDRPRRSRWTVGWRGSWRRRPAVFTTRASTIAPIHGSGERCS
jgi:putative Holliday junction resolvase